MKSQNLILVSFSISSFFLSCSKDDTAPVITMLGKNPDSLIVKTVSTYDDPGATASDDKDGDITSKIVVASNVNVNQPGHYLIYYTVEDKAHNQATKLSRVVEGVKADGNYKIDATCNSGANFSDTMQVNTNSTYDTLTLNTFYNIVIKAVLSNGKYIFNSAITNGIDSVEGEITVSGTNLTINFTYHPDIGLPITCNAPMVKL
ncbi:MAG: immunoglobulin-like domain-containing protein [Bacteroidia bacterium]